MFLSDISDGMVNDARRNIEAEYANENGADSTAHKTGQLYHLSLIPLIVPIFLIGIIISI